VSSTLRFSIAFEPPVLSAKGQELLGPAREMLSLYESMRQLAAGTDKLAMQIELGVQSATLTLLLTVRAVPADFSIVICARRS